MKSFLSAKSVAALLAVIAFGVGAVFFVAPTLSKSNAPQETSVSNLLAVLGLKTSTTFKFDENFGWVTGSDTVGLLIEKDKISALELSKSEAKLISAERASTFRSIAPKQIDAAFLEKNFPAAWKEPRAQEVMKKILSSERTGALLSPGKGRALYVAAADGTIYYVDQSPVDAPSATRLVPIATPKVAPTAKKTDENAKMNDFLNNLPPCSSGKFPCKN